jgi:lipoprotein-anchoring transpeptidase ErfK/SrfK
MFIRSVFAVAAAIAVIGAAELRAEPLSLAPVDHLRTPFDRFLRDPQIEEGTGESAVLPPELRRQVVSYPSREAPGTIVIDTPNTYLYYVLGGGSALRYGIGVGREGFTWSGTERVSRTAEWPDWSPPPEMIGRQPYLPRFMAGGPGNPLGARALYLGNTAYRIHGTNDPTTIGHRVSSGCIRLTNEDVIDLYGRVRVGAKVIVLPAGPRAVQSRIAPIAMAYR